MDIPIIRPPALHLGDTIAIIAPASSIEQRESFEQGIATLQRIGFRVQYDERIFQSSRYLAGEDNARAEELMRAFEDPAILGIIALRGGYGCSRLVPLLAEDRLRNHPKVFMGFSDLTTLHLYFFKRFGWITIHGPMAASPSLGILSGDQEKHMLSLWTDPQYRPVLDFAQLETWAPGVAEGRLVGGCLAVIESGMGTPCEIETEGNIMFLEDSGEPPYKLDRMLTHLRLAAKLQSVSGILLGGFEDCEPAQGKYTAADTLREILTKLHVPVLANFPAGHGLNNWAIPLGGRVRMDANARSIEFLDSAVS